MDLDPSGLLLDRANTPRFANALRQSKHPVPTLSLNISQLTSTKAEGLDQLLHFVQTSVSLLDVQLAGSDVGSSCVSGCAVPARFLQAIAKNPKIQQLSLYNMRLDAETFSRLVVQTQTLTHLTLANCTIVTDTVNGINFTDQSNSCIDKVVSSFGRNKSIESLRLVSLEKKLLVLILEQLKSHSQLKELDVSYGCVAAAQAIGQVVSSLHTPFLERLVLRDSPLFSFEHVVRSLIIKGNNNTSPCSLKRLDIVNCDIDSVSASLLRTLYRSKAQSIQRISFCNIDLEDDSHWEEIFQGISGSVTLRHLLLHRVNLQDRDLQALTKLLQTHPSLRRVDLDGKILFALAAHDKSPKGSNGLSDQDGAKFKKVSRSL